MKKLYAHYRDKRDEFSATCKNARLIFFYISRRLARNNRRVSHTGIARRNLNRLRFIYKSLLKPHTHRREKYIFVLSRRPKYMRSAKLREMQRCAEEGRRRIFRAAELFSLVGLFDAPSVIIDRIDIQSRPVIRITNLQRESIDLIGIIYACCVHREIVSNQQVPRDYSKENILSPRIRFIIDLYFDEGSVKRNIENFRKFHI